MNCLTFRHLLNALTAAILLSLFPTDLLAAEYELPKELTVKVNGKIIKGFWGNPAGVKEAAAEEQRELPPEGFVYRIERGPDPKINLAVWSVSKQEAKILKAAETKITQMIYDQQTKAGESPTGFLFDQNERTDYGTDQVATAPVRKSPPKRVPGISDLKPVLAGAPQDAAPATTLADTARTWRFSTTAYWILIALLVLVGIAWGQKSRS